VLIALTIGGDDYVKKPYSLSVLLAKVKVNLKRIGELRAVQEAERTMAPGQGPADGTAPGKSAPGTGGPADPSAEQLSIDPATMSAIRGGERIPLKAKEFALLKCLYDHKNTIVTKEVLFNEVWGDAFYSDGTLNVHIRKLREKLEEDPNAPKRIKTVWGTGYILETEA
jgi:two-component system response regulator RegX3